MEGKEQGAPATGGASEVRESRGGRGSRRGEGVAWVPADGGGRRGRDGGAPTEEPIAEEGERGWEKEEGVGYKIYEWALVVVFGMKMKYE
jgi:hypothetical protein